MTHKSKKVITMIIMLTVAALFATAFDLSAMASLLLGITVGLVSKWLYFK